MHLFAASLLFAALVVPAPPPGIWEGTFRQWQIRNAEPRFLFPDLPCVRTWRGPEWTAPGCTPETPCCACECVRRGLQYRRYR